MLSEPHKLGVYGAIRSKICAQLELEAASDDGHIDTVKGTYFAKFHFWHVDNGAYVNLGYNARGFNAVFSRIKPMAKELAAVMMHERPEMAQYDLTATSLERCIADLEKQTTLLGTINELPPTPMCSHEPRARQERERP